MLPRRALVPVAGVVTALGLGLLGCGAVPGRTLDRGSGAAGNRLAPLSAAIGATDSSRAALLADLRADDAAAAAADIADTAALSGSAAAVATLLAASTRAVTAATTTAARTRAEVVTYADALGQLQTAADHAPISAGQRRAIAAVVTAGRTEAAALRSTAVAYGSALPTYQQLGGVERSWLGHADSGWFATTAVAAGAYQVARSGLSAPLAQARQAISAANATRQAVTGPAEAALAAARTALASLNR